MANEELTTYQTMASLIAALANGAVGLTNIGVNVTEAISSHNKNNKENQRDGKDYEKNGNGERNSTWKTNRGGFVPCGTLEETMKELSARGVKFELSDIATDNETAFHNIRACNIMSMLGNEVSGPNLVKLLHISDDITYEKDGKTGKIEGKDLNDFIELRYKEYHGETEEIREAAKKEIEDRFGEITHSYEDEFATILTEDALEKDKYKIQARINEKIEKDAPDRIEERLKEEVEKEAPEQIEEKLKSEVDKEVQRQQDEYSKQFKEQTGKDVDPKILAKREEYIRPNIEKKLRPEIEKEVRAEIYTKLEKELRPEIEEKVKAEIGSEVAKGYHVAYYEHYKKEAENVLGQTYRDYGNAKEIGKNNIDLAFFVFDSRDTKLVKEALEAVNEKIRNLGKNKEAFRDENKEIPKTELDGKPVYKFTDLTEAQAEIAAKVLAEDGINSVRFVDEKTGKLTLAVSEKVTDEQLSKALSVSVLSTAEIEGLKDLMQKGEELNRSYMEKFNEQNQEGSDITVYDAANPDHYVRIKDGKGEEFINGEKIRDIEDPENFAEVSKGMVSPAVIDTADFDRENDGKLALPWMEVFKPLADKIGAALAKAKEFIAEKSLDPANNLTLENCLKVERQTENGDMIKNGDMIISAAEDIKDPKLANELNVFGEKVEFEDVFRIEDELDMEEAAELDNENAVLDDRNGNGIPDNEEQSNDEQSLLADDSQEL